MSFTAPRPVISGQRYQILSRTDASPDPGSGVPGSRDFPADFLGETSFSVEVDGSSYLVQGFGTLASPGVHVHQKDAEGTGKDIRVWQVELDESGQGCTAEHLSPSQPTGTHTL